MNSRGLVSKAFNGGEDFGSVSEVFYIEASSLTCCRG